MGLRLGRGLIPMFGSQYIISLGYCYPWKQETKHEASCLKLSFGWLASAQMLFHKVIGVNCPFPVCYA